MTVFIPVLVETREGKTERSILAVTSSKDLAEKRIAAHLQVDLGYADERGFEVWEAEIDGKMLYKFHYDGHGQAVSNVV